MARGRVGSATQRLHGAAFLILVLSAGCASRERSTEGRWYKGNTHTHSLWSDGDDFPESIVDWYKVRGYDFLALSDHNELSQGTRWMATKDIVKRARGDDVLTKYRARFGNEWVEMRTVKGEEQVRLKTLEEFRPLFEEPEKFLLVQGEEITDEFEKKPIHINAINLEKLIPPQRGGSVRETIRNNLLAVREQERETGRPILPHLNHPNFGWAVTAEDLAYVLEEEFFEVYNGHPSIHHMGDALHPGDERLWDIANSIRLGELLAPPLLGVATDDAHHWHGRGSSFAGRGWIFVRARELSAVALMVAMRAGDFYASSGVVLRDVTFDATTGVLALHIEPRTGARFTTQFIGTHVGQDTKGEPP